ncbi:hypothetical protein ACFUN8_05825 [Streptomyces sp. NPDC057307]|uniref:MmyB family transcriptional regulator n=1 Tax=Streptomyces sp. NPDC057307 TaxID=3346096 RepID=UPI00363A5D65
MQVPDLGVLEAVAHALKLDAEAADPLNRLCLTASQRPRDRGVEGVSPQLLQLMDGWEHTPAFVVGPALDILAGNSLTAALHEGFTRPSLFERRKCPSPSTGPGHVSLAIPQRLGGERPEMRWLPGRGLRRGRPRRRRSSS